jgi:hypothetical protein
MEEARRRGWIVAIRTIGLGWIVFHLLLSITTPVLLFAPFVIAGPLPFLYGAFSLRSRSGDHRRMVRAQRAVAVGFALMAAADIYMFVIIPRFPQTYPFMPLVKTIFHTKDVPTASPLPSPATNAGPRSR